MFMSTRRWVIATITVITTCCWFPCWAMGWWVARFHYNFFHGFNLNISIKEIYFSVILLLYHCLWNPVILFSAFIFWYLFAYLFSFWIYIVFMDYLYFNLYDLLNLKPYVLIVGKFNTKCVGQHAWDVLIKFDILMFIGLFILFKSQIVEILWNFTRLNWFWQIVEEKPNILKT